MKETFFACIIITLVACSASARKVRLKHKIDTHKPTTEVAVRDSLVRCLTQDSIGWDEVSSKISFYGFDKTVNSMKESLFAVNGLDSCAVAGLTVEVTYLDMKGRQLHRRSVELECEIPAGETRRVDFPTWDTQKAFYYHKSAAPKKQATPFKVKVSLKSLTINDKR